MDRKILVFAAVLMLVGCAALRSASGDVFAAANQADILYGKGVHAFFGDDYQEAIDLLSEVDELQSEDPRPYFFLGLAYGRLGDDNKAIAYLKKAARLEWVGRATRDFGVSEALRRIQGYERLTVEGFRKNARTEWQNEEKRKNDIKYGKEKVKDREIVARMAQPRVVGVTFGASSVNPLGVSVETEAAPTRPASLPKPIPPKETEATTDRPGTLKGTDTPEKKAAPKADEDDPFAAPAKDKEKKAMDDEDDPFADSGDKKAEDKEKEPEPKKADEDEDDEDDPFK